MERSGKIQKAFTLIELMVVIAIIAILAAMLMVALMKALQNADDVKCIANLRNIATGVALYMTANKEILPWERSRGWCVPFDLVPDLTQQPPHQFELGHYPNYFFAPLAGRGPDPPFHHQASSIYIAQLTPMFAAYSSEGSWAAQTYPFVPSKALFECDAYAKYSYRQTHIHHWSYNPDEPTNVDYQGWIGAAQSDYGPNSFIMAKYGAHWNDFFYGVTDTLRVSDVLLPPGQVIYLGHSGKSLPWFNHFDGEQTYLAAYPPLLPPAGNCSCMFPHYWSGAPDIANSVTGPLGMDTGGPSPQLYLDMSVRGISVQDYMNELDTVIGPP